MPAPLLPQTSRYRGTSYYARDGVSSYGEWEPPEIARTGERLYIVTDADLGRADLISYRVYGTTELWWVALHYNNIQDSWTLETGDRLRMPSRQAVDAALAKIVPRARDLDAVPPPRSEAASALYRPRLSLAYFPPPYRSPYLVDVVPGAAAAEPLANFFNFAFPIPAGTSNLHFQIQVSEEPDFTPVLLSRMSAISQERWFYYDPTTSGGGYRAFPAGGVSPISLEGQTVYYSFSEGLVGGRLYYLRHRAVQNQVEQGWTAAPPVIVP